MEWLEWEQLPGKRFPRWKRTLGFEKESGEVFVPAAIARSEKEVHLCALYDGTRVAVTHKHLYVPASWISKEFPETKEIVDVMVESAKKSIEASSL